MMYSRFFLMGLTFLFFTYSYSQPASFKLAGLTGLDVYQKDNLPLEPLVRDKYVILDFFATWCPPCVKELVVLDSLQMKFRDRLQVVVISREDRGTILKFFENKPVLKNIALPFIVGDTQLNNLFPHRIIPHEIWIDNSDIVMGITSHKEVNTDNIEKFIAGADMKFFQPKIDFVDFDLEKPLLPQFVDRNGSGLIGQSACFGFIPGVASQLGIRSLDDGRIFRIVGTNYSPFNYYYSAFIKFKSPEINRKRVLFEKKDSVAIFEDIKGNMYAYEFVIKEGAAPDLFATKMIEDLNRYTKIKAKVEKRMVAAWSIKLKKGARERLKSKGEEFLLPGSSRIRNVPIAALADYLSLFADMQPVFDETGLKENVDMDLDFSMDPSKYPDIDAINRCFSRYGLQLTASRRMADMLVLSVKK